MKKLLFLTIILFSLSQSSKASHTFGGEIGWTCLASGKYIFYMTFYKDCTGIQYNYVTETITIYGSPLPRNSSGNPFSTITMDPDSNRWIAERNGDISPSCTNQYGTQYTCDNRDPGTVQQFFYTSAPITLAGNPDSSGWRFFWQAACCRPGNIENMLTPGPLTLRAEMFPTKDADDTDPCIDSSPRFVNVPATIFCRGQDLSYSSNALDSDLDSLVYSWDRPYNGPGDAPVPLMYEAGYEPENPTPDTSFDVRNVPSSLNSATGMVNMAVYSGERTEKFMTVIQVDAYRDGVKLSSVFREIPISIINCDSLIDGKPNTQPKVYLNQKKQRNLSLSFAAGKKINLPITIVDSNYADLGITFQTVSLTPFGQQFSTDFSDTTACNFPPCAILKNTSPVYDSSEMTYLIKAENEVSTSFEWQTDCSHLGNNGAPRTHIFYYKAEDGHCPVPGSVSGTIEITLYEDISFVKPRMNCLSVGNGINQLSWNTESIDTTRFEQYYIYGATTATANFNVIDSISNPLSQSYSDNSTNGYEFYYIQTRASSCDSNSNLSQNSDTIRLVTDSLLAENLFECIQLNWGEAKSSYGDDEKRRYLIYREESAGTGFQLLDSVENNTSYCDTFISCGSLVRYYVKGDDNSAVCNFRVDTVSIKLDSAVGSNLVQVLDNSLRALEPVGLFQWYDCSTKKIITGETNRLFTPKDTGIFSVIITQYGCSDTSQCLAFFPVGIEEMPFGRSLSIYPNPSSGIVQLKLGKQVKALEIKVMNIQGQIVQERSTTNSQSFQWELPNEAGIYFIQLTNEKGEQANLKVVKQ